MRGMPTILVNLLWDVRLTLAVVHVSTCRRQWAWNTSPQRKRDGCSKSAARRAFGTGVSSCPSLYAQKSELNLG